MVVYGYVIDTMYTNDATYLIKVRIPSIHGPVVQTAYDGQTVRNYVKDEDLPWYPSLLLPASPNWGSVVALISTDEKNSDFLIIGLTGAQYTVSPIIA